MNEPLIPNESGVQAGREGIDSPAAPGQSEEALRQAQAYRLRYQELFEFAPDGYLVTDSQGVIREANYAGAVLLQRHKEFLPGKPLGFFVAAAGRRAFYTRLQQLGRLGDVAERWEVCLQPPPGGRREDAAAGPRDVEVAVTAIPNAEGQPAGFRWLLRDVTPQRRAEQALRAEKHFADSLVQTVQAVILILDDRGRILRSNPHLWAAAGWTEDEVRGQDWHTLLLPEDDWPWGWGMVRETLASGACQGSIRGLRTRDGRCRVVAWSARALATATPGGTEAVMLLGHDITDLQEAQRQALRAARLAAIGQMMTGLAHESRNALQRTRACLERLRWRLQGKPPVAGAAGSPGWSSGFGRSGAEDRLKAELQSPRADAPGSEAVVNDTEVLDLLDRAQHAQDDLVRLFEDVRAYAAPIRLVPAPCDLAEVWREAWGQVAGLFPGIQAHLCEHTAGVDLRCRADRFRLAQVFRNVLDNAFTAARAAVRVDVACRETVLGDRPALRISVRDDGPGLNAEQRQRLFEPFFTTKVKGTGLGLAIARRIVEAHGGQIAAGDNPPPGAEFLITLPRGDPDSGKR